MNQPMNQHPVLPPDVSADDAEIHWTDAGRPFVRTPDDCFEGLPDYPWEPNYAEVDGMRMHYVDAGDPDGEVVLLLHGQPDWSYLYRKMIPVLADAGFRVIAPDLIGFGKSDKPVQLADYRFLRHVAWVEEFIDVLDLDAITPVVQDWGSLIGLRCVGNRPDRFARVVVANGNLLVVPEGVEILTLPVSLEPQDLEFPHVVSPGGGMTLFEAWATYALVGRDFMPSVPMAGHDRGRHHRGRTRRVRRTVPQPDLHGRTPDVPLSRQHRRRHTDQRSGPRCVGGIRSPGVGLLRSARSDLRHPRFDRRDARADPRRCRSAAPRLSGSRTHDPGGRWRRPRIAHRPMDVRHRSYLIARHICHLQSRSDVPRVTCDEQAI